MILESSLEKAAERTRLLMRALQHRNYRLFFAGQTLSLIGTWMQQIAMSWLVYRVTGSALLLGVVGFAGQIPTFVLAPLAGVLADRWNKHRVLLWTQSLSMLQAAVLTILILGHLVQVWHIIALSVFIGVVNAFDIPARQSFLIEMIDRREDLGNAIALNSSMMNGTRLIGPSIAGVLIATLGEGICFLLNAVSYLAVLVALLAMRVKPKKPVSTKHSILHELREGIFYAYRFAPIRAILLLIGLVSLTGIPYTVLLPVFARDILHGGANTFGFLMAAAGVGAFTSAILLASRKSVVGLGKIIPIAAVIFGLAVASFAFSRSLWLSLVLLFIAGLGMMAQIASSNTILQTLVDDDKRGRIMSLFTMSFMGMAPFGSLLAGALAGRVGVTYTLLMEGSACCIGALVFASRFGMMREHILPTYRQKGIIPEVVSGLQTATELTIPPEEQ
jgi:MFS family permease